MGRRKPLEAASCMLRLPGCGFKKGNPRPEVRIASRYRRLRPPTGVSTDLLGVLRACIRRDPGMVRRGEGNCGLRV